MGCGCGKRQGGTTPRSDGHSAPSQRGVQRSKMKFVVSVTGEESEFLTLREARVFADKYGSKVETRRVAL